MNFHDGGVLHSVLGWTQHQLHALAENRNDELNTLGTAVLLLLLLAGWLYTSLTSKEKRPAVNILDKWDWPNLCGPS